MTTLGTSLCSRAAYCRTLMCGLSLSMFSVFSIRSLFFLASLILLVYNKPLPRRRRRRMEPPHLLLLLLLHIACVCRRLVLCVAESPFPTLTISDAFVAGRKTHGKKREEE